MIIIHMDVHWQTNCVDLLMEDLNYELLSKIRHYDIVDYVTYDHNFMKITIINGVQNT